MLTFRTIPPTPSGHQLVYLIPNGGLTATYCYDSLYGPFSINGASASTSWTLPDYYTYNSIGLGAPLDSHGRSHENNCSHLNIKGEVTTNYSDQYGDSSPYEVVGRVLTFTDTVDGTEYYQSLLSPYGLNDSKKMVSYDKNSDTAKVIKHPRLYGVYSTRKSGELDNIWVRTSNGRENWWTKKLYVSQITPSSFHQEYIWVNEWIGKYGEVERDHTIYDLVATKTEITSTGITITYTGTKKYQVWQYGVLKKDTSEPYTTTCTGFFSSPPLTCGTGIAIAINLLRAEIMLKVGKALNACTEANTLLDASSVCCSAIESVSPLDMNNIENGSQLRNMGGFLPPIKESIQLMYDPENPKKWLKAGSSWYLWYKYCVKPTASDIKQLVDNQKQIISDTLKSPTMKYSNHRARQSEEFHLHGYDVKSWCSCNVKVRPQMFNPLANLYTKLDYLGLSPCLSNLWDLIPFSFVVDWFANVGDALRQLDVQFLANLYDVGSCTIGRKSTVVLTQSDFSLPSHTTISQIIVSDYSRSVTAYFPRNEVKLGSVNPSRHVLDGAALICANW